MTPERLFIVSFAIIVFGELIHPRYDGSFVAQGVKAWLGVLAIVGAILLALHGLEELSN